MKEKKLTMKDYLEILKAICCGLVNVTIYMVGLYYIYQWIYAITFELLLKVFRIKEKINEKEDEE